MNIQDAINSLNRYSQHREKTSNNAFNRAVMNQQLNDLIQELCNE